MLNNTMIFRNFLETLYGPKVQIKLIAYMLQENMPTSEREIAGILNVSHVSVNIAFKKLQDLNLVLQRRVGSSTVWEMNKKSYAFMALNLEFLAKNNPLEHLKGEIRDALRGCFVERVAIFGSIAEGKELPTSDIDLLVVTKHDWKKRIHDKLYALISKFQIEYGNRLSFQILTKDELVKLPEIKKAAYTAILVM